MRAEVTASIAALVAFGPAAFTLWSDRALVRAPDDPALPERLLARRSRTAAVGGAAAGLIVALFTRHAFWALPLLVILRMLSAYPMRRAVYRETWSVVAYLSFFLRLTLAIAGFWLALALTPTLVRLGGHFGWVVAIAVVAVLVTWNLRYPDVARALLRAEPVDDPELLARSAAMAQQCGLPPVWIARVPVRGGVFANALALPSATAPGVLITETLLEAVDREEAAGIVAHELAHLEHHGARIRKATAITVGLIVFVAALVPLLDRIAPGVVRFAPVAAVVAVLIALAARARDLGPRQQQETASDLRALELTGTPEALIGGLTKLHAIARIPRRWKGEFERRATHPSLARRIQAIRVAAGAAAPGLQEPVVLSGVGAATTTVTFDANHLAWLDAASSSHTFAYERLVELRIDARASGQPTLVATDGSGRRWTMPLHTADVPRVQAALDIVDSRLGRTAATPDSFAAAARLVAAFITVVAAAFGQIAAAFVALLAAVNASAPMAAAAGIALLVAASVLWRAPRGNDVFGPWAGAALAVSGLVLVATARLRRAAPADHRLTRALAIATALALAPILVGGFDAVSLHQASRAWSGTAVLASALAAAVAVGTRGRVRYAAAIPAVVAAAVLIAGSLFFLVHASGDPFVVPSADLVLQPLVARPVGEFAVHEDATGVLLSPSGFSLALSAETDDESPIFYVGRVGGALNLVEADDAAFVDDTRLLLLDRNRDAARLRLVDASDAARVLWEQSVRGVLDARLSVDRGGRWQILGRAGSQEIVAAHGTAGVDGVEEQRWRTDAGRYVVPVAMHGDAMLLLQTDYRHGIFDIAPFRTWAPIVRPLPHVTSTIAWVRPSGPSQIATSRLAPTCDVPPGTAADPVCFAFDGERTRFFAVRPDGLVPLAAVQDRFYGRPDGRWMNGRLGADAVLIDAPRRAGVRIARRRGEYLLAVAAAERQVAVLSTPAGAPESILRLYPLP